MHPFQNIWIRHCTPAAIHFRCRKLSKGWEDQVCLFFPLSMLRKIGKGKKLFAKFSSLMDYLSVLKCKRFFINVRFIINGHDGRSLMTYFFCISGRKCIHECNFIISDFFFLISGCYRASIEMQLWRNVPEVCDDDCVNFNVVSQDTFLCKCTWLSILQYWGIQNTKHVYFLRANFITTLHHIIIYL
jgi:hypothetical protein